MIRDHRAVVDRAEIATARRRSLSQQLDEEILPRLERPGRLLGPFESSRAQSAIRPGSRRVVLLWPSPAEDAHVPVSLQPLRSPESTPLTRCEIACAPGADLEHELRGRGLPVFSRPSWRPLTDFDFWLVWLESPLQVLGLLTMLRGCGLETRAAARPAGLLVAACGPGAVHGRAAIEPFVDLWLGSADATLVLNWVGRALASFDPEGPASAEILAAAAGQLGIPVSASADAARAGRTASFASPSARVEATAGGARAESSGRTDLSAVGTVHRPVWEEDLRRPLRHRTMGRGGTVHDRISVWAGSASLRRSLSLPADEELAAGIEDILSREAGTLELVFALGLPGETEADRAAIPAFVETVLAAAPREVRQVSVRLHAFVPGPAALAAGGTVPAPEEFGSWVRAVRAGFSRKKLRVEHAPSVLPRVVSRLGLEDGGAATWIETLHLGGSRTAESVLASSEDLWHKSMELDEFRVFPFAPAASADDRTDPAAPAPSGLRPLRVRLPAGAASAPPAPKRRASERRGRKRKTRSSAGSGANGGSRRQDRWTRWQALAPRQFDYRLEFAKLGRMRFLSQGETTELILRACERSHVPLATSGVVQPRPKISFGPSLPVGIEGAREYVDLGLCRKIPGLEELLNEGMPEGLEFRAAHFMPSTASHLALSQVAVAVYESRLGPSQWRSAEARSACAERVADFHARFAGASSKDDSGETDPIHQLRDIRLIEEPDDHLRLDFSLDLRDPGVKCKPRELVARLLDDLVLDVHRLPIRRIRLLAMEEIAGRSCLRTPMEQVVAQSRRTRAKAKHCA